VTGTKIYTKTGDQGQTSLLGGKRVAKSNPRLDCFGTVDELNCIFGLIRAEMRRDFSHHVFGGVQAANPEVQALDANLERIQNTLFNLGSQLASENHEAHLRLPQIHESEINELELWIDHYTEHLPELKNFILPGGAACAAQAHFARTVCRRAERLCVLLSEETEVDEVLLRYLNRLSDYAFVLARYLNHLLDIHEVIWSARTTTQTTLK
jgi:cob(I)alamin adenosyltransferase